MPTWTRGWRTSGFLFTTCRTLQWARQRRDRTLGMARRGKGTATATATVVAVAKIDLELQNLMEIGGVYTFPEHRNKGYGASIVRDIAHRIRQSGKTPTLQVDEQNGAALHLYEKAGWQSMGKLARVWLTG